MIPDLGSKGCAPWQVQDSVLASQGQSPCRVWDGVPTGIKNTAEGSLCILSGEIGRHKISAENLFSLPICDIKRLRKASLREGGGPR